MTTRKTLENEVSFKINACLMLNALIQVFVVAFAKSAKRDKLATT